MLPWVRRNYDITSKPYKNIIGGIDNGALISAYIGMTHSNIFGHVISQSGSFWWSPKNPDEIGWLITEFYNKQKIDLKFYIDVGVLEDKLDFSMVKINKKMKMTLENKGYKVKYNEYKGGYGCLWRGECLANALIYFNELNK